jgi:hypothetical protein
MEIHKMDEINGIKNIINVKYGTCKLFDTFWLNNIDGDQNIKQKMTLLRNKSFLSWVVHLKEFGLD